MNEQNLKIVIGLIYLTIISVGLYFLFTLVSIGDLMSYEFIKSNRDIILKYKNENFLFLSIIFFTFSIIWILLLGFAMPLLLFAGFVFGKWWGLVIILVSSTIGATLLYILAGYFFREIIEEKFEKKFLKLKDFFNKNDTIYFMSYRFVGGGGTPYAIQNILPVLFNMPIKNYIIATFLGSFPSMFVTVALGSGAENIIGNNEELTVMNVLSSPEIYLPLLGFFIILTMAFIIKKFFLKT
tara:strand:- start:588 stop:1307 length:720 start_codon:yes stop_codon:yes gene_type:complete